jgi:Na+/H+ antiporter NhaD/arsenite permease-like protein
LIPCLRLISCASATTTQWSSDITSLKVIPFDAVWTTAPTRAHGVSCEHADHLLPTAANVGSTGTITGNPQNIYIGAHSGISYLRFAARLLPVALLGLGLTYFVVCLVYRNRLTPSRGEDRPGKDATLADEGMPRSSRHAWLQIKAVVVTLTAVALFFTGLPLELVALGAAAFSLLDRIKPEKIYREVDWSLLVMFTGLFIVVHAFQVHVVATWGINWVSNPVAREPPLRLP